MGEADSRSYCRWIKANVEKISQKREEAMGEKEKVLVVDDEPSIRKYLQTLLEVDGFEVETVLNIRALRASWRIFEVPSFEAPRVFGTGRLRTTAARTGSRPTYRSRSRPAGCRTRRAGSTSLHRGRRTSDR